MVDRIVVEESRVVIQHVVPTGPVRLQTEQVPPEKVYSTVEMRLVLIQHMTVEP